MTVTKNTLLFIVFAIVIILFLSFDSGSMMNANNGMMGINNWMVWKNFGWIPAIVIFSLGVLTGWLIFRRRV